MMKTSQNGQFACSTTRKRTRNIVLQVPQIIKPDFRSIDHCCYLESFSFLKSLYRRDFLPAEICFAAERKSMVTLLAFNVKIEKSILKYFTAEESSNVTILDGNISWCRYLFGDRGAPLQNG